MRNIFDNSPNEWGMVIGTRMCGGRQIFEKRNGNIGNIFASSSVYCSVFAYPPMRQGGSLLLISTSFGSNALSLPCHVFGQPHISVPPFRDIGGKGSILVNFPQKGCQSFIGSSKTSLYLELRQLQFYFGGTIQTLE